MEGVSREQVKDFIKNMTLMDAAALVKELEEELGVSAAAPVTMAAAAAGAGGAGGGLQRVASLPGRVRGADRQDGEAGGAAAGGGSDDGEDPVQREGPAL